MKLSHIAICALASGGLLWGFSKPYQAAIAPVAISKSEAEYTQAAWDAGLQGEVLLTVVIDEKGIPTEITVKKSLGFGLDEKAVEAARKWRFKPGTKAGSADPVKTTATIAISFRLLQRAK